MPRKPKVLNPHVVRLGWQLWKVQSSSDPGRYYFVEYENNHRRERRSNRKTEGTLPTRDDVMDGQFDTEFWAWIKPKENDANVNMADGKNMA